MGSGTAVLVGLRSFVVLIAMAVIGLGAWALNTINDIGVRGSVVIDMSTLNDDEKTIWQEFFDGVNRTEYRIWIAIATGCFTFITTTYIFLAIKVSRPNDLTLHSPPPGIPHHALYGHHIRLLSLLRLAPPTPMHGPQSFHPRPLIIQHPLPLSKGYAIAGGTGWFILTITTIASLVTLIRRRSQQKGCSFEPTASSLGMSHGYQAVVPPPARTTIPTLYDPRKPIPGTPARPPREDEEGFMGTAKEMSRRDSGMTEESVEMYGGAEKEISGPLSLERPEKVAQMRPARPWSEAPKRKG